MQRTVNINGKEYPLEDEGFALNGVLEGIRSGYKELKKAEKENISMYVYGFIGYLNGLKLAYRFITGKEISYKEIKELANNEYNEKHKNDKEDGQYKANLMNDPFLF